MQPAKMLRLHFGEHDRWNGRPLYEAVVEKCRELEIAGATVYRGLEGYGETAEIHRSHDRPVVVTVVDTADNIARLLPVVEQMIGHGLIAISDVEVVRVRKTQ